SVTRASDNSSRRSRWRGVDRSGASSYAPRRAWPGSGERRVGGTRLTRCLARSTTGSLRGSTPLTSGTLRPCSTSCPLRQRELGMLPRVAPLPPRPRQALPAHGQARAGAGASHDRDSHVPRDGHDVLAGEGGGGNERVGLRVGVVNPLL